MGNIIEQEGEEEEESFNDSSMNRSSQGGFVDLDALVMDVP
jgi:hypothetical protein